MQKIKEEGEVFGKLNVENKIGSEEKTVKTTSNDCIKAWPKKSVPLIDCCHQYTAASLLS